MPTMTVALPETKKSILNSVYFGIVEQIATQIGIAPTELVVVHNDIEISKTDNRNTSSIQDTVNRPSTVGQRRITAVISETYNDDYLGTDAVREFENTPYFMDAVLGIVITPVYVRSEVTVSFQFTTPSKTEARRLRDDIRVHLNQARNILHHDVVYNVIYPKMVETFVEDVHELRSRLLPNTLSEYFRSCSIQGTHLMSDLVGTTTNHRIAVREGGTRIIGVFDFGGSPDAVESDNSANTHKLTVPYKFSIDVPRWFTIKYPPMVCNRPMPAKYLQYIADAKAKPMDDPATQRRSISSQSLSIFESNRSLTQVMNLDLPLNLPTFDTFRNRIGHAGYAHLVSVLVVIDETDKVSLLNLKEIDGDYQINPKFLEYIRTIDREKIIHPHMSCFYLGLHQDDTHFDNNILTVDANLNVKSKVPLRLIKPTRVTLSVNIDVTSLDHSVMYRMYEHKDYLLFYLTSLIQATKDFRVERLGMFVPEHTLQRFFLLILEDGLKKKQHEFLSKVIDIIGMDGQLMGLLTHTLYHSFPQMYRRLSGVTNLENYRVNKNFKSDYLSHGTYAMSTVMLTSVEAGYLKDM
ncbi:MAG: hypothetical protein PHN51_11695 [Candidatus Nanopelagicales bacterium]|nr:hypothetical protein [Candidatus Nanopelagicales bacterium]